MDESGPTPDSHGARAARRPTAAGSSPDEVGRFGGDSEKHLVREPEGPAHKAKGGFLQSLKRSFTEFKEDNGTDWAAALTYYSVLSIFPALIAMMSIVGLVADPKKITKGSPHD